jgi:hydrogenase nickel incorporation protein HypA/HybF
LPYLDADQTKRNHRKDAGRAKNLSPAELTIVVTRVLTSRHAGAMHELSLAERALQIVDTAARQAQASRVTRIRLAVGALAHVDAETLRYCCELVSRDTLAAGARIDIERLAGRAHCRRCAADVALQQIGEACPHCGSFDLNVTGGDQLQVLEVAIEEGLMPCA